MKDATFQRRLRQCWAAKIRYLEELAACESEYTRRFGADPSQRDDDFWIDSFHCGGGAAAECPSVADVTEHATLHQVRAGSVYCDRCDGCGWYEGGKTLQTECEVCDGTGVVPST